MEIANIPGESVVIVSPDEFSWFLNLGGLIMDWLQAPEIEVHVFMATHRSTSDVKRVAESRPLGVIPHHLGWGPIGDDPVSNGQWIKLWNSNHPKDQAVKSSDDIPPEWKWAVAQDNVEIPGDLLGKVEECLWDKWAEDFDADSTIPIFPIGTAGPMSELLYRVSHRFPCLHYLEWPSAIHGKETVLKRTGSRLIHTYPVARPDVKATFFRRIFFNQTSVFPVVANLRSEMVVGPEPK